MSALEIYVVGGAVRDTLLGQGDAGDLDWVVVGATPAHMVSLGFVPVAATSPFLFIPTLATNLHWLGPNAKRPRATKALVFTPHPM